MIEGASLRIGQLFAKKLGIFYKNHGNPIEKSQKIVYNIEQY